MKTIAVILFTLCIAAALTAVTASPVDAADLTEISGASWDSDNYITFTVPNGFTSDGYACAVTVDDISEPDFNTYNILGGEGYSQNFNDDFTKQPDGSFSFSPMRLIVDAAAAAGKGHSAAKYTVWIVGCDGDGKHTTAVYRVGTKEIDFQGRKLEVPAIFFQDSTISWTPVENADWYLLKFYTADSLGGKADYVGGEILDGSKTSYTASLASGTVRFAELYAYSHDTYYSEKQSFVFAVGTVGRVLIAGKPSVESILTCDLELSAFDLPNTTDYAVSWDVGGMVFSTARTCSIDKAWAAYNGVKIGDSVTCTVLLNGITYSTSVIFEKGTSGAPDSSLFAIYAPSVIGGNDGYITGVSTDMQWSSDVDFAVYSACTSAGILNLEAGDYYIRFAESSYFAASAAVKVTVPEGSKRIQAVPSGIEAFSVSHENKSDGRITGVSDDMEYSSDANFVGVKACTGTEINELAAGDYYIRYKETDIYSASPWVKVTVGIAVCPSEGFSDVGKLGNAWYHEAVDYVKSEGIMSGKSGTKFVPNASLTRAEFVQVLYNMENKPAVTIENPFCDVPENAWYYNAVLWAKENNIANGTSEAQFSPGAKATREQVVLMLMKYIILKGGNTDNEDDLSGYTDASKVSSWALNAIQWAIADSVISGTGGNRISPQGITTRAQIAQMIYNYYGRYDR